MLSKPDIHWIKTIQGLFNIVLFSYSLPAVYILLLVNPFRKGMILTSNKGFNQALEQYFNPGKAR